MFMYLGLWSRLTECRTWSADLLRGTTRSISRMGRRRKLPPKLWVECLEARALLTTFDVGPGLAYTTISQVPWDALQAGDTVAIHYRAEPYHELILVSGNGTADAPIRVVGVPGPEGQRPIIDGENAIQGPNLDYVYAGLPTRGLVTISPDDDAAYGVKPSYIEISGLQIRNAHLGNSLIRPGGSTAAYLANVAGIFVERGEHITIRDCEIDHNSNGLFIASGDEEALQSREILIQANYIHDNGNSGSDRQHNVYTEAIGITFEHNRFAPLLPGAGGANLKDRSAGLLVRYNWIEGGAYLLDLVDAEGSFNQAGADPRYLQTYVYGNVLLNRSGPGNASNLVHYGGDSGEYSIYRNGTLYFYQNTVVIEGNRTGSNARWFTDLFRLDTNEQTADVRNNIFYAAGNPEGPAGTEPTGLALFDNRAGVSYFDSNWISPGWHTWYNDDQPAGSSVSGTSSFITNAENDPGFVDISIYDLRLAVGADAIDQSGVLPVMEGREPTGQYVLHQRYTDRVVQGSALDLGAFEGAAPIGAGRLQFSNATQSAFENTGTTSLTVKRTGGTVGAVSVQFTIIPGTALADVDYIDTSGVLNFAEGQSTAVIALTLIDNGQTGADKTLQLQLTNPLGGADLGLISLTTLTIQNDETPAGGTSSVSFSNRKISATLASGEVVLTLIRTGNLTGAGQIQVNTQSKSAKSGVHFTNFSQVITFPAGQDRVQVTISLLNQMIGKGRKKLKVLLSEVDGSTTVNRKGKLASITLTEGSKGR